MSTTIPNLSRKSAPIIARETSAIVKTKGKLRRKFKVTFNIFLPNVEITVPLAADREQLKSLLKSENKFRGRTEISAPVSIRK